MGNCGKNVIAEEIASAKALRSEYVWYVQETRRPLWGGIRRKRSWEDHVEKDFSFFCE